MSLRLADSQVEGGVSRKSEAQSGITWLAAYSTVAIHCSPVPNILVPRIPSPWIYVFWALCFSETIPFMSILSGLCHWQLYFGDLSTVQPVSFLLMLINELCQECILID